MADKKTKLYCPFCGKEGLIEWYYMDCPNGHNWYNCPDKKCQGNSGFYIADKA